MIERDTAPLAFRLRPLSLTDFVGQEHILGSDKPLRIAIEKDALSSVILAGPPGTGKTTMAHIVAAQTKNEFVQINAVTSGVKELKEICAQAEQERKTFGRRTVLFIDEIHRFNTAQQDALLPFVESGAIILIGATVQNPFFDVNKALLSRSQVYLLNPLSQDHLLAILRRAVRDASGYDGKLKIEDAALERIAQVSNGDARIALNMLELVTLTAGKKITFADAEKFLRDRRQRYDKRSEDHYDRISAFIKSMRGSDVDAALLWLFSMIEAGEEPRFLFRRMAIFASEDIGNADPRALQIVVAAWQAFELVGYPEGEFFLAHACVYSAQAPKSNAVTRAMGSARETLRKAPGIEVPMHLRNAPVQGMKDAGYHATYQYPHTDPSGVVPEHYFPQGMMPKIFYEPTDRGFEAEVRERLERIRGILHAQN